MPVKTHYLCQYSDIQGVFVSTLRETCLASIYILLSFYSQELLPGLQGFLFPNVMFINQQVVPQGWNRVSNHLGLEGSHCCLIY